MIQFQKGRSDYMKKIFIILGVISVSIISLLTGFILYEKNYNSIEVSLNGDNPLKSNVYEEYKDPGITVKNNKKELSKDKYSVEEKDNVDKDNIGSYSVNYDVKYKNKNYNIERKVEVVDTTAPVITTNIEEYKKDVCNNKEINKLEYKAEDNYDGDITNKVERIDEEDKVILKVTDSSNNSTTKEIKISYTKRPNPILKLNGNYTQYVLQGTKYDDKGVNVLDGCTNNKVKATVTTEGTVDTNTIGTYTIKYTAKVNNYTGTSSRKVVVIKKTDTAPIKSNEKKVVYLTFDDGPGPYTSELLNILDKYNVKVTFFVTNQFPNYQNLIAEESKRGHVVAVHSYTHKWNIYKSVEAYENDFKKMDDIIFKQTGKRSEIFRFPGGGSNTVSKKYATGVVTAIKNDMQSKGYVYFDWNVDSNDAGGSNTEGIYNNVIRGIRNHNSSVVLLHDIHSKTIPSIERIIKYAKENGYTFKTLSKDSPTCHHKVRN